MINIKHSGYTVCKIPFHSNQFDEKILNMNVDIYFSKWDYTFEVDIAYNVEDEMND